ncbi:MAG TPA: hypothetical protein VL091_08640 [Marinobacter sp.]|nr:hypothetical protein [Marinobacter sp.]
MNRFLGKNLSLVALLLASPFVIANDEMKHGQVGIASYATVISPDYTKDEKLGGFAVYGTGAFNDNFAGRLLIGFQSHNDYSEIDITAFEGSLLAGTGLATEGFKAYGSLGFYNEKWEVPGFSEKFGGGMIGGGVGYNWQYVSLEFWMNFRSTSDYEDVLGQNATAASGGLGLAGRF